MARKKPTKAGAKLTVAESTKNYMMDGVRYVCENFKRRKPGSDAERNAQDYLANDLKAYADEVKVEPFDVHPEAFMGFIPIAVTLILIATALFLFGTGVLAAILSAVLPVLATLMFLFEFLFYRNFVDFLFPKKTSANVYAVRKASGETKKRIIFGGHTDAPYEWRWSLIGEKAGVGTAIFGGVIAMLSCLIANIVNLVYKLTLNAEGITEFASKWQGGWLVWSILLIVTAPLACLMYFFINYKVVCDGANDNLSADFISMAVLKEMADSGVRLENTEVCCLLTGCEEAGLRGAKAFAKAHNKEILDSGVDTVYIALDTMREVEELRICNSGCSGTVFNDKKVGKLLKAAGEACGVDLPYSEWYPGAVDAEAFSMYGLRANGLTGVSHDAKRYYHTRQDTPDNMDADCLTLSLNICKEAVRIFDEQGAD